MRLQDLKVEDFFDKLEDLLYKPKVRKMSATEMSWYSFESYPLDTARNSVELDFPQVNFLYVFYMSEGAIAQIQIDRDDARKIGIATNDKFEFPLHNPLHKVFLTNDALPGEYLILLASKGFKFTRQIPFI